MSKKLVLVGGGGHCKSVLDSLIELNEYNEIVILDVKEKIGENILGYKIVGTDSDLKDLKNQGFNYAFLTIGNLSLIKQKVNLYQELLILDFIIPNIIDKSAIISINSILEQGIFIGKSVIVNAGSSIGHGVILNSNSLIEHDVILEDFVQIAPRVCVAGNVLIKENSFIGMNTSIRENTIIGKNSVVGMGSNILRDVPDNVVIFGNPGRIQ